MPSDGQEDSQFYTLVTAYSSADFNEAWIAAYAGQYNYGVNADKSMGYWLSRTSVSSTANSVMKWAASGGFYSYNVSRSYGFQARCVSK